MLHLPTEILSAICRQLPNRDIKSLRLTCSLLKAIAPLRLDRVFLSANRRDLDVFQAIADSDVFRNQIMEIVWDDTILPEDDTQDGDSEIHYEDSSFWDNGVEEEQTYQMYHADPYEDKFPGWFARACKESLEIVQSADIQSRELAEWTTRPIIPISESWAFYQQLLLQQQEVLQSNAHVRAFEDAWVKRRFPALRTITITPAAHGRLFYPLFQTPMIRSFPPGFIYNVPRGWPVRGDMIPKAEEWDDDGEDWPAFRAVTSIVARHLDHHHHPLPQLRLDAFELPTGLNIRVFEEPCRALTDFTALVAHPAFQHLHLDLLIGAQERSGWPAFTRGHLARALSAAQLHSLSIQTDAFADESEWASFCVSLRTVCPPASLAAVRHFALGGFCVREDDLLQTLAALPRAFLQTVRLRDVSLVPQEGDGDDVNGTARFCRFLERVRDELQWRGVKLTIGVPPGWEMAGLTLWVDVDDFLYRGGPNPFELERSTPVVISGFGTWKDRFNASYERPNLDAAAESKEYPHWYDVMDSIKCRP
ncbi:hypothetical protein PG990_015407 [Apiospora arundinis]